MTPDNDPVNPQHYRNYKIEVIEILEDAIRRAPDPVTGSLQWQTLKYMLRLWDKDGPLQDAKKARWYLDRLITTLEGRPELLPEFDPNEKVVADLKEELEWTTHRRDYYKEALHRVLDSDPEVE